MGIIRIFVILNGMGALFNESGACCSSISSVNWWDGGCGLQYCDAATFADAGIGVDVVTLNRVFTQSDVLLPCTDKYQVCRSSALVIVVLRVIHWHQEYCVRWIKPM